MDKRTRDELVMDHVGTRSSKLNRFIWTVQDRRSLLCLQLVAKVLLLRVIAMPGGGFKPPLPVTRVIVSVQFSLMTDSLLDVAVTPIDID